MQRTKYNATYQHIATQNINQSNVQNTVQRTKYNVTHKIQCKTQNTMQGTKYKIQKKCNEHDAKNTFCKHCQPSRKFSPAVADSSSISISTSSSCSSSNSSSRHSGAGCRAPSHL